MKKISEDKSVVIKEGKFIRFLRKGHWEYVERHNCTGIVIILALTDEKKVLFTEQLRVPVGGNVIEYPAGLVNDSSHGKKESPAAAAKRELLEETGYKASKMVKITSGPTSSGSSSDIITLFRAEGLRKIASGGGDDTEAITVHEVPINTVETWLDKKRKQGCLVDPKIYAGLYFLKKHNKRRS